MKLEPFDDLMKRTTDKRTIARGKQRGRELIAEMMLSEIRKLTGKSQREVAEKLGIRQPSLSKLERQSDMQISTLKNIVTALGGELGLVARFPKGTLPIDHFGNTKKGRGKKTRNSSLELHLV